MSINTTYYSELVPGDDRSFRQPVTFDLTDGYLGVSKDEDDDGGLVTNRVLLSPAQVRAMLRFLREHAPKPKRRRARRKATAR